VFLGAVAGAMTPGAAGLQIAITPALAAASAASAFAFSGFCNHFRATRSYALYCHRATPSIWGNLTGMCVCSNAEVQSSRDNVKKSENPFRTIC